MAQKDLKNFALIYQSGERQENQLACYIALSPNAGITKPCSRPLTAWLNLEGFTPHKVLPLFKAQCPAVIVSSDAANQFLNRVQIVPLTSNVAKLYSSESYVTFLGEKSKAMADQLTTVSKKRLINYTGSISSAEIYGVSRVIKVQMDL